MSWNPTNSIAPVSRLWGTLAFRLTAWYTLAGLFLVFVATTSLYLVLLTQLDRSTDLFLADKLLVLRTLFAGATQRLERPPRRSGTGVGRQALRALLYSPAR